MLMRLLGAKNFADGINGHSCGDSETGGDPLLASLFRQARSGIYFPPPSAPICASSLCFYARALFSKEEMAPSDTWRRATHYMLYNHPDREDLAPKIEAIAYMKLSDRKQLLKMSRTQRSFSLNPFLRGQSPSTKSTYATSHDLKVLA
jgi:hypothetical protein